MKQFSSCAEIAIHGNFFLRFSSKTSPLLLLKRPPKNASGVLPSIVRPQNAKHFGHELTKALGLAISLVWVSLVAHAGSDASVSPRLEDFPKIVPLTESQQTIRRVELGFQVLMESTQPNLSDLHVFDARGQLMPSNTYYLRSHEEELATEVDLQFFPFGAEADPDAMRITLQVKESNQDTQISVSSRSPGERGGEGDGATNRTPKTNYVVHIPKEIRNKHGALAQLELDWVKPDANLIVPVRIEGSADLQQWQTLSDRAVVSDLQHNGAMLRTNTVALNGFKGAYLRLTWPASVEQFDLLGIRGEFTKSRVSAAQLRHQTLACGQSKTGVCEVTIPQQLSAHSYSVTTGLSEYFLQGTLYSNRRSSAKNSKWIRRGDFQQYRLTVDNEVIGNSTLRLPNARDRNWRLHFSESGLDLDVNEIEIHWYPVYQAFLAQGQGPYQLVYGNADQLNATRRTMDTILARAEKPIDKVSMVYLGGVQTIERVDVYWTQQRIEMFVLWAVLLVGVGILFRIAWGLYRGLNSTHTGQSAQVEK
jgi:hypothetical protein